MLFITINLKENERQYKNMEDKNRRVAVGIDPFYGGKICRGEYAGCRGAGHMLFEVIEAC